MSEVQTAPVTDAASSESTEQVPRETPSFDPKGHKYKVKVDDREEEWDYDTVIREAQKGRSSDKKWREAKEMADVVEEFKKNPWAVVEKSGKDKYQYAEELMNERLEFLSLSPQQREAMDLKRENADLKKRYEDGEKSVNESKRLAALEKVSTEIDSEIAEAVKALGFKPTPRIVGRLAEVMLANLDKEERESKGKEGYQVKKLSAKEALSRVKDDFKAEISDYVSNMSVDDLMTMLPKKQLDALRRNQVDNVRTQDPMERTKKATQEPVKKQKASLSTDDWFNNKQKQLSN